MTRLTLVVLVDALRADYPRRMPFLRSLAVTGHVGAMREDFGFVPRAAYFGGLTPSEYGFTNMYCYDPARSPFGLARGLPTGQLNREAENAVGLRRWLDQEARRRVTPFAAAYLSSADIPLDVVANFDVVEKRAPWDCRVGYRSVFTRLRERNEHWFTCAWPESNLLADRSDRGIVAATLAGLRPPHRLGFVHLQELDGVGHVHGPESAEVDRMLAATDNSLRELVGELERRFDGVDLVLFGDHGMVPVSGTVDVSGALRRVTAVPGRDYVIFLDSTMARFWFHTAGARREVVESLQGLPGRVLTDEDLAALDLAGCDPRNGELIFLADPGVLVAPNFFQRRGPHMRGMHGYHPDCPDNLGFFLVRPADGMARGTIGVVRPTAVYEHTMAFLGLADPPARPTVPGRPVEDLTFTCHPDPDAEALVADQLAVLVDETRREIPEATAIILTGSFGRGEGGVARTADGRLRPVNDYDILLVAPEPPAADVDAIGARLAAEFGLDFVHFSVWPGADPALPLTLANFDVVYGHRVLWGPADILATLPRFAAADMPVFEAVQLVLNRMAGLLTGVRGPFTEPAALSATERRYLQTQTMKALMALGDVRLMAWRAYACSYRTRLDRISWLGHGAGIPDDQLAAIIRAYRFKLEPSFETEDDLGPLAATTSRWLLEAFVDAAGRLSAQALADPADAAGRYYELTTGDASVVEADNRYCATRLGNGSARAESASGAASIRQSIYAALPLLLAASHGDAGAFSAAVARLNRCLPPSPSEFTAAAWDAARRRATGAWLTLVH